MQSDIKVTIPYDDFSKLLDNRLCLAEKLSKVEHAISLYNIRKNVGCDETENAKKFYKDIEDAILTQNWKETIRKMHIGFSERLIIAKCFEQWSKENAVSDSAGNFVSWMYTMGFLYIDKVNEYAEQNKDILHKGG